MSKVGFNQNRESQQQLKNLMKITRSPPYLIEDHEILAKSCMVVDRDLVLDGKWVGSRV